MSEKITTRSTNAIDTMNNGKVQYATKDTKYEHS
jgi:hypothetical protein